MNVQQTSGVPCPTGVAGDDGERPELESLRLGESAGTGEGGTVFRDRQGPDRLHAWPGIGTGVRGPINETALSWEEVPYLLSTYEVRA